MSRRTGWFRAVSIGAVMTSLFYGGELLTASATLSSGASSFVPITPCRLLDTRAGSAVGPRVRPLGAQETYSAAVWGANGNCSIPSGATGVSMNVVAINPSGSSYLTVFPSDEPLPLSSSLNWIAGQAPTPNAVTVRVSAAGMISFFNNAGTVDLAADVVGYYEASGAGASAGPQGPAGPAGPVGGVGAAGPPGPAGPAGPTGDMATVGIGVPGTANVGRTTITVDSAGVTGSYTSLTIGADGFPVMSYYDSTNGDLRAAHCNDVACSTSTTTTVDAAGDTGSSTSVAIGTDELPVISYTDASNNDLRVAHCTNTACTASTSTTVDTLGGNSTSITIGADGLPVISYATPGPVIRVAHCNDIACSAATTSAVDVSGAAAGPLSTTVGADGFPVIAYFDSTSHYLRLAHCLNVSCTSSSWLSVVLVISAPVSYPSVAIGIDGLPVIAYGDSTSGDLHLAHCSNVFCLGATTTTVDATAGAAALYTSIAIGVDGYPLISYSETLTSDLHIARCANVACTVSTTVTLDAAGTTGYHTSIAVGDDGLPVISYQDVSNGDLRVAHCTNLMCLPNTHRR